MEHVTPFVSAASRAPETVNLPRAITIVYAFRNTGAQTLAAALGATPPGLGESLFWDVDSATTVTVKVPFGAMRYGTLPGTCTGADTTSNWGNAFRGQSRNDSGPGGLSESGHLTEAPKGQACPLSDVLPGPFCFRLPDSGGQSPDDSGQGRDGGIPYKYGTISDMSRTNGDRSAAILEHPGIVLECSAMSLEHPGTILERSEMVPEHSGMILERSEMVLEHSGMVLEHPAITMIQEE